MDLTLAPDLEQLRAEVAAADVVVPVGARTQWEVGGDAPEGVPVHAPRGIASYDPADLTVTVNAGTPVDELAAALAEAGQECALDPRDPQATVGGVLAAGLSGPRRLAYGPLRDRVLEVRFVTGDGRVVRGGGPTVKNVTGYDIPRLLVGSLGTIGVITQVILRCRPRPEASVWSATADDPDDARRRCFRPACVAWDGRETRVLLEGHPADVAAQQRAAGLETVAAGPRWPQGRNRGRISVVPARVQALGSELAAIDGLRWVAEIGVGTVHVAADEAGPLLAARRAARRAGGWMLREAGAFDPFGMPVPNAAVMRRIREAFDPAGKMNPGRLPW